MDATESPGGGLIEASYGALRTRSLFRAAVESVRRGERCILRTERGVEAGVVTLANVEPGTEAAGEVGDLLRIATPEDEERRAELALRAQGEDLEYCRERIRARELPMRLVFVEHLFGGGRIVFYFVADGRVDFRELVKDLARHFRTRIELRQIGVRDEAKILGDHEYCDRELCCVSWMREILPVTMRMAKNQKSTLDPNKISGRCSRLKCCLRFEDEVYRGLRADLPPAGARVETERGPGKVLSTDALTRSVYVELDSEERLTLPLDGVRVLARPGRESHKPFSEEE